MLVISSTISVLMASKKPIASGGAVLRDGNFLALIRLGIHPAWPRAKSFPDFVNLPYSIELPG